MDARLDRAFLRTHGLWFRTRNKTLVQCEGPCKQNRVWEHAVLKLIEAMFASRIYSSP